METYILFIYINLFEMSRVFFTFVLQASMHVYVDSHICGSPEVYRNTKDKKETLEGRFYLYN